MSGIPIEHRSFWRAVGLAVVLPVTLGSCVLNAPPPRNSRFTVDISNMQKADFYHDTWVYQHPTKKVTDYDKFILSPFKIYRKTAHRVKQEDRVIFDDLEYALREKTFKALQSDCTLVDTPSEGTLRIDIEIFDIKPIVVRQKDGNESIVTDSITKGSKLEVDCFDAVSGELIYAISTLYKGDQYAAYQDASLEKNIEDAFDEWFAYF